MKQLKFFISVPLLLLIVTKSCSQSSGSSSVLGVFVASTPCSQGTKPVPGIPANSDCELIKWNITFSQDETKKTPTTFILHGVYGLPKQGTTGFIGGGKKIDLEGKWSVTKGSATNPNATVYQLIDDKTNKAISFLKLNDNLLHLLDSERHLMIGSAAWSYTFSRINKK